MSADTMTRASVKNRLSRSFLEMQLDSLRRQQRSEVKSMKNDMKKFKSRYSKLDAVAEGKVNDGSDVRMYDTHYPGFCYKRNGEYRIPQAQSAASTVDFEDIHGLLFTNGEVDIEKVLCLHLVAAHKTESLSSPPRGSFSRYREQSPVERLIEKSKRKKAEDSLAKMMPTYVLDVETPQKKEKSERTLIRDGRLAARLLINEKITQIIDTVLAALRQSNPRKVQELLQMAANEDVLVKILNKPRIQEFLEMLKSHALISSYDCFRLSPPFKTKSTQLSVQTIHGGLENLIGLIRKNVLQAPNSTWAAKMQTFTSPEVEILSTGREDAKKDANKKHGTRDFIAKNKEALANIKKQENFDDEDPKLPRNRRRVSDDDRFLKVSDFTVAKGDKPKSVNLFDDSDFNAEVLARTISEKVESAYRRDLANKPATSLSKPRSPPKEDSQKTTQKPKRHNIKKTTCEACLEKFKEPLPPPKTPIIKRNCIPVLTQDTYKEVTSESMHRISQMIDREYNNVRSRRNSRSSSISSNRSSRSSNVREGVNKQVESVELDEMDLARIRQEIMEKETQKKLEQFLQEKL